MRTEIDTSGLSALASRLRKLDEAQTSILLERLGDELLEGIRWRIRVGEASPDGQAWRPLSPRHARRTADATDMLQDDGGLLRSMQQQLAGDSGVAVGSPLVYAGIHQHGGRGIPARPYLGIGADEVSELELIAAKFLEDALTAEPASA